MKRMKYQNGFRALVFAVLSIVVLFGSQAAALAEKPTTYLAPGYQNIESDPQKAIIPVGFLIDETKTGENKIVSVREGFDMAEARRKVALLAVPVDPEKYKIAEMVNYLKSSSIVADSIKLRHIARINKLDLLAKSGDQGYADYYKKYSMAPILVSPFGSGGCAMAPTSTYMGYGTDGEYFSNSFIKVTDGMAKISDRIKNDTLALGFAHENAHAIMNDMYIKSWSEKLYGVSTSGHDGPIVSDRHLAYTEGWAEAFEAIYGQMNPLLINESEREKYGIAEFQFTRQDPVRRNRYTWVNHKGKKTGIMKNALQLISTEGAIASTFFDIMTARKISDPFLKSTTIMYKFKPADFVEFLKVWVREYPEDKQVLYRIFLEESKYITMSNEARKLYYEYYQDNLKFKQGKITKEAASVTRDKWLAFKEDLFKKAMDGAAIDSNIGPDLWLAMKLQPKDPAKPEIEENLNISTFEPVSWVIRLFENAGITEAELLEFIKAREATGVLPYKTATEALEAAFGAEKAHAFLGKYKAANLE